MNPVDEHDPSRRPPVELAGDGWVLDGRLHPDEVADATGCALPEGGYETLAGYLLARFGRIPAVADAVELDGWRFEVVALDRLRIAQVRITPPSGLSSGRPGPAAVGRP